MHHRTVEWGKALSLTTQFGCCHCNTGVNVCSMYCSQGVLGRLCWHLCSDSYTKQLWSSVCRLQWSLILSGKQCNSECLPKCCLQLEQEKKDRLHLSVSIQSTLRALYTWLRSTSAMVQWSFILVAQQSSSECTASFVCRLQYLLHFDGQAKQLQVSSMYCLQTTWLLKLQPSKAAL